MKYSFPKLQMQKALFCCLSCSLIATVNRRTWLGMFFPLGHITSEEGKKFFYFFFLNLDILFCYV